MAERRMFAKTIIDSDAFLEMPLSTQALYFHLSMRADDEGFVNNPKKIQRVIGASEDDLKLLNAKNFIIPFDNGVVVIKHWKIHNYIRKDRLVETQYKDEKALLTVKENGAYTIAEDIKEIQLLDAKDKRKIAYQNSSLPYSFSYKIRRAFEGCVCPSCGKRMTSSYKNAMPTIQHNLPISKGGEHEIDNISVICESCNTSIKDNETGVFNKAEVIEKWDKITLLEKQGIKWFDNPEILNNLDVSQMSVKCQSNVSIGKVRLGKDSIGNIKDIVEQSDCHIIIDYLNQKTGKHFKDNAKATVSYINGRIREGYTVDDFKTVIDTKTAQWINDPKMKSYLRPETLFAPSHFESYLNETGVTKSKYSDLSRKFAEETDRNIENTNVDSGEFI